MKAAVIVRFGPPNVLRIEEVPDPILNDGMVRVRVRAIGLNFADIMARLGVYPGIPDPPFVPGIEFAGEVIESADGVRGMKIGTRVMGFSRQGAYAEQVCVPASWVRKVPPRMSWADAAAFTVTSLTAYHGMKTLGQIRKGETMLLHAAAGGVGTAALQLAKNWGVITIATASTPEKLEVAKNLGAAHLINYQRENLRQRVREITKGRGVDVVMDSVGGRVLRASWKLLAPMGRYVLYGFASVTAKRRLGRWRLIREVISTPLLVPTLMTTRNVSFAGFNLYFLADKSEYLHGAVKELLGLFKERKLIPIIGRVFSFEKVVEAHSWLQSRQSVGKIVLTFP